MGEDMNTQVYNYFVDLNKSNLPTDNIGNWIITRDRIKELDTINTRVHECILDDQVIFYAKEFEAPNSIMSIASSHMYNELGILTPPEFALRGIFPHCTIYQPFTFSQDVTSLNDLKCTMVRDIDKYNDFKLYSVQRNNKWEPLYNPNLKKCYLSFMTEDCFDDLIGLYLVDEIRTDRDRHNENLFLYRTKPYGKFEGVLPIDLERAEILEHHVIDREDFQEFIKSKYHSYTPMDNLDIKSYETRINDILQLIQDGVLSKKQMDLLKRATNYDLPKNIKNACERYNFEYCMDYSYTPIAHLWDYNHKHLDRELR